MTFHLVTEIDDIDGTESVRFVTARQDLAERAQHQLRCHGLRVEIHSHEADTLSLDELELAFA